MHYFNIKGKICGFGISDLLMIYRGGGDIKVNLSSATNGIGITKGFLTGCNMFI